MSKVICNSLDFILKIDLDIQFWEDFFITNDIFYNGKNSNFFDDIDELDSELEILIANERN